VIIYNLTIGLVDAHFLQNSEVRSIMQEVNGLDGINLMQLTLAMSLWC
jgi:hypothetical protein